MASFCASCVNRLFDVPALFSDMTNGQVDSGLCEGCGPGLFNEDGFRVEIPDRGWS